MRPAVPAAFTALDQLEQRAEAWARGFLARRALGPRQGPFFLSDVV
jgi:hypothetical protein